MARVVGVDPGPIPGVALLTFGAADPLTVSVFQCDPGSVLWLVSTLLTGDPDRSLHADRLHAGLELPCPLCLGPCRIDRPAAVAPRTVLAVERFIVGMRSSKLSTPRAGAVTRDMVGAVTALGRSLPGVTVMQRCAAEVMPWASDQRLTAAGLLDATRGMPHARAAARHALYSAAADGGLPDPLSKVRAL